EKQLLTEFHALNGERIVSRQSGHWESCAHLKFERGELLWQVKGREMRRNDFLAGQLCDAMNSESAQEIFDENCGNGVAVARMGGRTVLDEGERARGVQHRGEVEIEFETGFVGNGERGSECDAGAVGIAREVISPAVEFAGGIA